MKVSELAKLVLLALTVPPTLDAPDEEPLPHGDAAPSEPVSEWTPKHAKLTAVRVRLRALGTHTHANWVFFRLPFDTTRRDRVRAVRFSPASASPTNVGALRIGSACVDVPPNGSVDDWARYTVGGVGGTLRFAWHPAPPTADPTILGINVPTRVANYAACGLDERRLLEEDNWTLEVTWEER